MKGQHKVDMHTVLAGCRVTALILLIFVKFLILCEYIKPCSQTKENEMTSTSLKALDAGVCET